MTFSCQKLSQTWECAFNTFTYLADKYPAKSSMLKQYVETGVV